ncbi:AAA family ATPase [Pseudomonas aeruginosa]|nr:AAA family ATPase [Pseudomonas aeruginosa]MDF5986847.1 AAA family ATPase [Pseudomonas aeruginosa]
MKLQAYRLQNYRRLRDVVIELDDEISIFVGANNSGKTSAVQGLYSMLRGEVKKFELFDFSAALWAEIDAVGRTPPGDEDAPKGYRPYSWISGSASVKTTSPLRCRCCRALSGTASASGSG